MPKVKINNLTVKYPPRKDPFVALDNLNVEFESGKVNVILGPSGSGKTTLLKAIIGILDSEGDIYFDDVDIKYISIKNRNIAYVDQNIRLYPHLNVFNNIAYPLTSTSAGVDEIKQRVYEQADLMHIKHLLMRKPRQISIGQAQRVAIAKAMIKKPTIYLLDEPFSNLDSQTTVELIAELKKIFASFNATVIFITHSSEEAFALGEVIYIMNDGKIIEKGLTKDIVNSSNEITKSLLKDG